MEYSYILIESVDLIYSTIPPQVAMAIMSGIGSLFGRKKRQGEWDSQKRKYDAQLAAFKDFDFVNPFADMENPFEEMRISTKAAEFQAQEQQAGLAQTLDALRGAGGGTGAAATATALARQQAKNQQQIAATLAKQEIANERTAAMGKAQLQMAEAKGEMGIQQLEFGRESTILGMEQQNYAAALKAQAAQRSSIAQGIAGLGMGVLSGYANKEDTDGFGDILNQMGTFLGLQSSG